MEGKDELILKVALELFLEKGYEKTNLKDIVDILGGSYATIYKKFSNKNQLFLKALELKRDERVSSFLGFINKNRHLDIEKFLDIFGYEYFNFFCNEENARFLRLIVARSYQDKTMQKLISKADRNIIIRELATIFEEKINKDILKNFDSASLASMYCSMIRADKFFDIFFDSGKTLAFDENEVRSHINRVNGFFLINLNG